MSMSDDDRDIDIESDEDVDSDNGLGSSRHPNTANFTQAEKRAHHNALERRRRDHIKESFTNLREAVPTLKGEKASRAQILKKTTECIQTLRRKITENQKDIEDIKKQNSILDEQISRLESNTSNEADFLSDDELCSDFEDCVDPSDFSQRSKKLKIFHKYTPITMKLSQVVADKVGVPVEAFRLLISLLAGYPIAAVYHRCVAHLPAKPMQNLYFAFCGISVCYLNFGLDTYHSLLCTGVTYLLVVLLRGAPNVLLGVNFIFHMIYLLLGYYFTASNEYDILWTMPHCILTLRMIGFGFDVTDGLKPLESLSKDQKDTALKQIPSFLETLAFAYFPSSFLIGPQFPYRRYQSFINGEFRKHDGCVNAGLKRLGAGVLYLCVCQVGLSYLPDNYFLSPDFAKESFIKRIFFLGFWAKFTLYKYITCWLFAEGSLMCIGFTYNGNDKLGKPDWSGCSNVKLMLFESGNTMQHYVLSFNVNTNHWVAHYIFKRLKFLNNRNISYGAALGFLAIWHGFHSGYYMAFVMEFMIVNTEKQIESTYTKYVLPKYGDVLSNSKIYGAIYLLCLKSYNIVYMGWCLTSFVFLKYERWITVYSAVNYFGFIYIIIWACFYRGYRYYRSTQNKDKRIRQLMLNTPEIN